MYGVQFFYLMSALTLFRSLQRRCCSDPMEEVCRNLFLQRKRIFLRNTDQRHGDIEMKSENAACNGEDQSYGSCLRATENKMEIQLEWSTR
jgi:hypothetical protein